MKKIFLALLLFCLCLPVSVHAVQPPQTMDVNGLTSFLTRNKGKVVLVNFFATWCPPCREEIPALIKLNRQYRDRGVVIIGLSCDDAAARVEPLIKKMGMDYPVYLAAKDLIAAFRVSSIPHNVFYDKDGSLLLSEAGMADERTLKMVIDKLIGEKTSPRSKDQANPADDSLEGNADAKSSRPSGQKR
ncbi:MAG: redoxin domain-containing protein [Desulfovibrio sp.]|nr:redoxin domain-containing protein [Desulfovibrio sp.]